MTTITVSIGRKVGASNVTLTDTSWVDFRDYVVEALAEHGAVVFQGTGTGIYRDANGAEITEESFTAIAVFEAHVERSLDSLRHRLGHLAYTYDQDSIALTKGETSFVEALVYGQRTTLHRD